MYFAIQVLLQNKVILGRIRNAETLLELVLSREAIQPKLQPNWGLKMHFLIKAFLVFLWEL